MAKSKHKRTPKTVLKLPDLEQSKSAVMNSLTVSSENRRLRIRAYSTQPPYHRTTCLPKRTESSHVPPGHSLP